MALDQLEAFSQTRLVNPRFHATLLTFGNPNDFNQNLVTNVETILLTNYFSALQVISQVILRSGAA